MSASLQVSCVVRADPSSRGLLPSVCVSQCVKGRYLVQGISIECLSCLSHFGKGRSLVQRISIECLIFVSHFDKGRFLVQRISIEFLICVSFW